MVADSAATDPFVLEAVGEISASAASAEAIVLTAADAIDGLVDAGKQTFQSLCTPCHLASLKGKGENPAAVGPNLTDQAWIHGGTPKEIYATVSKGVLAKGMPTWEPVLGQKKTAEVVAYVLSFHEKGEPITAEVAK